MAKWRGSNPKSPGKLFSPTPASAGTTPCSKASSKKETAAVVVAAAAAEDSFVVGDDDDANGPDGGWDRGGPLSVSVPDYAAACRPCSAFVLIVLMVSSSTLSSSSSTLSTSLSIMYSSL